MPQARASQGDRRPPGRLGPLAAGLGASLLLSGCASIASWWGSEDPASEAACASLEPALREAEMLRQAQSARIHGLTRDVERLRADLADAEAAMVTIESGLRGAQTRADAVSALAEARISVERAHAAAPWRDAELAEVKSKLEEAEQQFQAGNVGSAVFFASRAQRIADGLHEEAQRIASERGRRVVKAARVNLRSGPSTTAAVLGVVPAATPVLVQRSMGAWALVQTPDGTAGWIHASLLESP